MLFNRNFASNPVFLGTERVSGKKVTDLFCLSRDVPGNGAGEIGVVRRGAEKSAFKKSVRWRFPRFSDGILRSLLFISKLNGVSPKSLPTFFVKREKIPRMVRVKFASEVRGAEKFAL